MLLTIPRARVFLIEDMRKGEDPGRPLGICEVKLNKGKAAYERKRLSLADMRRIGWKERQGRISFSHVLHRQSQGHLRQL